MQQQHRTIEVGDATLECTVCGLGAPVVLLANAGCSTGYFDHLARALVTGGFQTISINMRGVGGSRGSTYSCAQVALGPCIDDSPSVMSAVEGISDDMCSR